MIHRDRYAVTAPSLYTGDDDVDGKFDRVAADKQGGAGFGTLVHAAHAAGMPKPLDLIDPAATFGADVIQLEQPAKAKIKLLTVRDLYAMPDPVESRYRHADGTRKLCLGRRNEGRQVIYRARYRPVDRGQSASAWPSEPRRPSQRPDRLFLRRGHGGFKRRIKAWAEGRGLTEEQVAQLPFYYHIGVPLAAADAGSPAAMKAMREAMAFVDGIREQIGGEPVLVVVDTMARALAGLDENTTEAATAYLNMTECLRDKLNCTVLTIAHATNKDKKKGAAIDFRGVIRLCGRVRYHVDGADEQDQQHRQARSALGKGK